MNTKTLTELKFKKSKSGKLSIFYKDKQLLVFSEKVLFQFIIDSAPSYFLKSLSEYAGVKPKETDSKVKKFAAIYAFEKLKYFKKDVNNLNDKQVTDVVNKLLADRKNVFYFDEAIKLMTLAGVTNISEFIKAQIKGLKFVNDGQGVFPSPNQLVSEKALTRLLEHTSSIEKSDSKEEKPARYWYFDEKIDGDISLSDNTKYQEALSKIKKGTADLNATLYAKKCYSRRRNGETYLLIENHLKKISE